MDERLEKLLRELIDDVRNSKGSVDDLNRNIARLLRTVDEDAEREARNAREEAERRQRHEASTRNAMSLRDDFIVKAVGEVKQAVEGVGSSMRDMPVRLLQTVEKKIYELRIARWELQKQQQQLLGTGYDENGEPLPLPPPPARPPTGQHEVTAQIQVAHARTDIREDEHTKPFARRHNDGTPRTAHEIVGNVVVFVASKSWKWVAATSAGAGLAHLLHKLGIL